MAVSGQPLKKNLKVPLEILQQLGAFTEVAKWLKEEMKELTKSIRDREKEVKALGGDAESDGSLRDLQTKKHAMEQQQAENKKQQDAKDGAFFHAILQLDKKIEGGIGARGVLSDVAAQLGGRSGISGAIGQLAGAGTFVGRAGLALAQNGTVSASAGLAVARFGGSMVSAAAAMGPVAVLAGVGAVAYSLVQAHFANLQSAADASKQIATATLDLINQGGSSEQYGATWLIEARNSAERASSAAADVAWENTSVMSKVFNWVGGTESSEVSGARVAANAQRNAFKVFARKMGGDAWESQNTLGMLRLAPDFETRYQRKLASYAAGGIGGFVVQNFYDLYKGSYGAMQHDVERDVMNEMQRTRMEQADAERKRVSVFGGGEGWSPEMSARKYGLQKEQNLQRDIRVSREYLTSQQWNKF